MEIVFTKDQATKDRVRFGGNVKAVYKRDGYKCVDCHMTMQEHISKYGRRLTINHIDGTGRHKTHQPGKSENHKKVNNSLDNLETLCLVCHGKKDGERTRSNQYGEFKK